jgi:hypothetical protein
LGGYFFRASWDIGISFSSFLREHIFMQKTGEPFKRDRTAYEIRLQTGWSEMTRRSELYRYEWHDFYLLLVAKDPFTFQIFPSTKFGIFDWHSFSVSVK